MVEALDSSETSVLKEPRGVTSQKTTFFIVTAVETSDPTSMTCLPFPRLTSLRVIARAKLFWIIDLARGAIRRRSLSHPRLRCFHWILRPQTPTFCHTTLQQRNDKMYTYNFSQSTVKLRLAFPDISFFQIQHSISMVPEQILFSMVSSGMLRRVALLRADVSEELSASCVSC
jgi:hypothetical protein